MEENVQSAAVKLITINELISQNKTHCMAATKDSSSIKKEIVELREQNEKLMEINALHQLEKEEMIKEIEIGQKNLQETKNKLLSLSKKLPHDERKKEYSIID